MAGRPLHETLALTQFPVGTEFVALIDSDDTWNSSHIQRALTTLGSAGGLFSDFTLWNTSESALAATNFFRDVTFRGELKSIGDKKDLFVCKTDGLISYFIREYVAHPSSLVYQFSTLHDARFMTDLVPGEDHLFFLDLASRCKQILDSTEIEAHLGDGINIFRETTSGTHRKILVAV